MFTSIIITFCALAISSTFSNPTSQQSSRSQQTNGHFINEKDDRKSEILAEDQDSIPSLNNNDIYQRDNSLSFMNPWNFYQPQHHQHHQIPSPNILSQFNRYPFSPSPTLFSMLGIPSTLYIPFPLVLSPDYLYPSYSGTGTGANDNDDDYDDQVMSRANGRRPSSYRNSPIYYVRIPPTPYMFVPGLGYTSQPPIFTPMLSYNPLSALQFQHSVVQPPPPPPPSISSMINLPLNFLSNGKPSNIYQLDPTNGLQSPYQPFSAPSLPPPSLPSIQRPIHRPQYISAPPPPPQPPSISQQSSPSALFPDSKITHLKRPYLFNGRPEDIYLLPNNFNSMQSIYQSPQQGYY